MAESSDILQTLKDLGALPKDIHWFCPREHEHDTDLYFDEDLINQSESLNDEKKAERARKVKAARSRQAMVLDAVQVFAFEGTDAEVPQQWLESCLARQMTQCDICVREFHRGRRELKQKLEDSYDEEEVAAFLTKFDDLNLRRIEQGLASATKQLEELPPEERGISNLDRAAIHAIFEAFNCTPFHTDEVKLSLHFDKFFHLVQTNKFLKLSSYSPAIISFLFGRSDDRTFWAAKSLQKFKRNITSTEFEYCVREPLLEAMSRVQLNALEKQYLGQFWDGVRLIINKLDKRLITHSLRALDDANVMEMDICRLAFSHLQIDDDSFTNLLAAVEQILLVSPNDFWEAMGTVSAISWIEQALGSPALDRLLMESRTEKISDSPTFYSLFSWVIPFLESIKPANRTSSCRKLVDQFMGAFQDEKYGPATRTYCFKLALRVLDITLQGLNQLDSSQVVGPTAREALDITAQYITKIAPFAKKSSVMTDLAAEVFKRAISLDLRWLTSLARSTKGEIIDSGDSAGFRASIWKSATRSLDYGNVALAKRLLTAVRALGGAERLVSKDKLSERQTLFNKAFDGINPIIIDWLERIGEFGTDDLESLFEDHECAQSILTLVFSSNKDVGSSAVELIKTMSGKSTRRDALEHLLRKFFKTAMMAISRSLHQIELAKRFTPSANVLKPCSDIIEILCNSQSGLLRSQSLSREDAKATEEFWQALWKFLTMVFSSTETWSQQGHDRHALMDFCRDTMDCADNAFEQFGVLRGALDQAEQGVGNSLGMRLIERPQNAANVITKWLKLRDDFLVSKSCALVCKLLIRLKEFEVQLAEDTLQFVVDVTLDGTRTTLSKQQKAELLRALETHSGVSLGVDAGLQAPAEQKKERTKEVIDLDKWTAKSKETPPDKSSDTLAKVHAGATPTYEMFKAKQASQLPSRPASSSKTPQAQHKPAIDPAEFKRKRERELAEKKRRDALALAQHKKRLGHTGQTVGEGSGIKGLGVQGKEHEVAPKGTGMMVSSDEESEDDDDDDMDKELFGEKSTSTKSNGLTSEQAKALKQQRQGPVKKQRLVRSTRDMRARLAPDLSALHKSILHWEYFHDGAFPPDSTSEDYAFVLNTFRDPSAYQRTFQPLLILEAWNGFLKAREENTAKPYPIKVLLRSSVDAFLEVSSTINHDDGKDIAEGDIVLLSKSQRPGSSSSEAHCLSRVFRITRKKSHMEVVYRTVPGTTMAPSLTEDAAIFGLKIMSIIPLEREYGALVGLQYYDLCEEITRAKPSPLLRYSDERLNPLMTNFGINKAQAKAVKCAIDNDAFTLVQGPPGSGKTKTIVAITGALLSDSLQQGSTMIRQPKAYGQQAPTGAPPRKLLVCAPSNAAVDELVMRFKAGVKTLSGEDRHISVVRLGRSDAINVNVQDVTLEELVNKKLDVAAGSVNLRGETLKIMEEHRVVSEKLRESRARLDEAEAKNGASKIMKEEFEALRRQKILLGQKVDRAKDSEGAQNRQADLNRKRAQEAILDGAHVICATLSGSGHDMFQNLNIEFETVIIDEAAQCVELSALIPLKYGCAKCILVGDPQQLPPTVFSKDAARFKYEQSLFVRMQANHPEDVHLLDTQYRMHPEISAFPSQAFYDSRLLDGNDMASLRQRPWHATTLLSPFRFFDVLGQHQSAPKGHSLINMAEIRVAMQLYSRLTTDFGDYNLSGKVGIITPYKSQLRELRDQFKRNFGQAITDAVEFNTTDAFQGRESEIIIFSCVRASPAGGIGFLQDIRRMNVGLTRAKSSLWVLGNSDSLMRGEFWGKLVKHAKSSQRYTTGDLAALLSKPLNNIAKMESTNAKPKEFPAHQSATDNIPKTAPSTKTPNSDNGTAPPVSTKRKRSTDEDISMPSSSSSSSSSSDPSSASSSDVEMTDAPPPAKKHSSAKSNPSSGTSSPHPSVPNGASSTPQLPRGVDISAKPAGVPVSVSSRPPPAVQARPQGAPPPPMRKKKEVDVFMKKKKPRP